MRAAGAWAIQPVAEGAVEEDGPMRWLPVALAAGLLSACVELAPALPELREDYMGKSLFEPEWEPRVGRGEPELE